MKQPHETASTHGPITPGATLRVVPARLLLLCLLLRSSWLAAEGGRQVAPPECYIAGAEGQLWPCRWAWLLAFLCESLVRCETPASDFRLLWMRKRAGAFRPQLLLVVAVA